MLTCTSSIIIHAYRLLTLLFIYVATGTFLVGFVETTYTVIEGDGQVEVCVHLIHPEGDIGNERVLVSVFDNTGPLSIPADVATASKLALLLTQYNCYFACILYSVAIETVSEKAFFGRCSLKEELFITYSFVYAISVENKIDKAIT